jgi:hypothetical protein
MTRTLRRSQVQPVEWASSGAIRLPTDERLAESSPALPTAPAPLSSPPPVAPPETAEAPAPAVAPAPADAPTAPAAAGAESAAPEPERAERSGPTLSDTLAVSRPRRRGMLVIVTAVLGFAALGVAISVIRNPAPRGDAIDPPASTRDSTSAAPPAGPPAPTMIPGAATPPTVPPMAAPTAVASDPIQSGPPNTPPAAAPVVPAGSNKARSSSGNSPRNVAAQPSKSARGNVPRPVLRPGIDCRDTEHPEAYPHGDPKLQPCPRQTPGN